jgi:hypothetical protein
MDENVAVVLFLFVNPVLFSCELMKCYNDGLFQGSAST